MATKQRSIELLTGEGDRRTSGGAGGEAAGGHGGGPQPSPAAGTSERRQAGVLTPLEVLRRARANVEHIGACAVKGELSEIRPHRNGHFFFKLLDTADRKAALPCVLWSRDARRLKFELKDGLEVVLDGKLSLSDFATVQLLVEEVQPVGQGAHELAFQQMKEKLDKEGLFAPERKRPLPFLPRAVGIVTSTHGAALHDVLVRLFERFPPLRVVVSPTVVQGEQAPAEIAAALARLDQSRLVDVILLVRGGGSREDLWAFNTEPVARAIVATAVPVICGVGHETDVSIADLVADLRAATPTAAAVQCVPELAELVHQLHDAELRMRARVTHAVELRRARVDAMKTRLQHAVSRRARAGQERLRGLEGRVRARSPDRVLRDLRTRLTQLDGRLAAAAAAAQRARAQRLALLAARLDALSPLPVLARGYAVATRVEDGALIRSVQDAPAGSELSVRVVDGSFRARVLEDD